MSNYLIEVSNLSVAFGGEEVVSGVSFNVAEGQAMALVGESGSGKTVTALSIPQLLPYPYASHAQGSIKLLGEELVGAGETKLLAVRGSEIGMIFQEPMTSLNPLQKIGYQVCEMLVQQGTLGRKDVAARARELFDLVGLDEAVSVDKYPHELSGGQRQRVMIALALSLQPKLLIADEPTTALDVTIQKQILELLKDLQTRMKMTLLLISHDLAVVRSVADDVCVMKAGNIVEQGDAKAFFQAPTHEYSKNLLSAEFLSPPVELGNEEPEVIAQLDEVEVKYPVGRTWIGEGDFVHAVKGVSLKIRAGQTVGIVGESGSGKTTLGLALLRMIKSEGRIVFLDTDLAALSQKRLKAIRRQLQIVFQDPFGSLSPRMNVAQIVGEGLRIHEPSLSEADRDAQVSSLLLEVGLDPAMLDRYPHEFSGGQRQRISIARALILRPQLIVMDEPTSALDVSVQAQIVDLLLNMQKKYKVAYLFISHDLKVVRALAHDLLVMKDGRSVEQGSADAIFSSPKEPYTSTLVDAAFL